MEIADFFIILIHGIEDLGRSLRPDTTLRGPRDEAYRVRSTQGGKTSSDNADETSAEVIVSKQV